MSEYKKLSHVVYRCDYHIVWVPKYRFRILTGVIAQLMEEDIRMQSEWLKCEIKEISIQRDHIHILVSVPPRVSISKLMGTLKGKTAIKVFKSYPELKRKPYWGNHFWARGYFVSTVGLDEEMIRRYVRYQEKQEKEIEEQQQRFDFEAPSGGNSKPPS